MKKLLSLLILPLLISLALPVYAGEKTENFEISEAEKAAYDSVALSEEEKSAYAASPEDTVIKIYARSGFLRSATSNKAIYDLLNSKYYPAWKEGQEDAVGSLFYSPLHITYYMTSISETEAVYTPQTMGTPIEPAFQNGGDFTEILSYITDPNLIFGEGVEVYHVYCFSECYAIDPIGREYMLSHPRCKCSVGMFVYYETEVGSYILFNQKITEKTSLYMFSAQEFYEYSRLINAYNKCLSENTESYDFIARLPEYFGFLSHTLSDFSLSDEEVTFDSLRLTEKEQNRYSNSIKIYCNSAFFDGSLKKFTIKEIAGMDFLGRSGNNNRVTQMYIHIKEGKIDDCFVASTTCAASGHTIKWNNQGDWSALIKYLSLPHEIFGSSVNIKNIYCFTADYTEFYNEYGIDYGHGCAIYYVTSAGDFVLYTPNTNEENGPLGALYMFTAEEFFEYTSLLGDECARERREGKTEYTRSLPEAFGFTSHLLADFKLPAEQAPTSPAPPAEPTPEPVSYVWIPVTAGVLVVLGGACAIIFIRKRKNK